MLLPPFLLSKMSCMLLPPFFFPKRAQQLCMCLKHEREMGELERRLDNCKHEGSRSLKSMGN
jgi:hypothetical protein